MAVRTNASGDSLSRTTRLPTITSFTMMGWFRFATNTTWHGLLSFGQNASGNYWSIQTNLNTTSCLSLMMSSSALWIDSTIIPVVNKWYHVAATVSGTGAGQASFYIDGKLAATGSGSATPTSAKFTIGNNPDSDFFNGQSAAIKLYSGVLTGQEIYNEKQQYVLSRSEGINGWYPLLSDSLTRDYSNRNNNLVIGGSITTESIPPIPWSRNSKSVIASSGTSIINSIFRSNQAVVRASYW